MVKESLIPKTETVYKIKNNYEVPSYEEFMKTYEPSEELEFLTEAEYQDRMLHGSQYGPGNEQSRLDDQIAKFAGRKAIGMVAGGLLGPIAIPVGIQLKEFSKIAPIFANMMKDMALSPEGIKENPELFSKKLFENFKDIGDDERDEFFKWIDDLGDDLIEGGIGSSVGSFFSVLGDELIKNGSSELGGLIKEMQEAGESASEKAEITSSFARIFIHMLHVKEGKNYDSNCEVCKA